MDKKSPEAILSQLPPEVQEEIQEIILNLHSVFHSQAETYIILLIKKLLEHFLQQSGAPLDYDALTPEQKALLVQELEIIAEELQRTGKLGNKQDLLKLLLHTLHLRYSKLYQQYAKVKEKEFDFMDEKTKIAFMRHMEVMMHYEIYKFMNPVQIAGETRLENFINNLVKGGMEYAVKHDTGPKEMLEQLGEAAIKDFEKAHENFKAESPLAVKENVFHLKGGGGGRGL